MRRYIIFVTLIMLMLPLKVSAKCDYNDFSRIKSLANNVSLSYDYIETNEGIMFSITISNMSKEIYIIDRYFGNTYHYNDGNDIVINEFSAGYSIKFDIYTTNSDCANTFLSSQYINLPSYNYYYKDPLCSGLESHGLCQKWARLELDYEGFKIKINDYKRSLEKEPDPPVLVEKTDGIIDHILSFLASNYYYILPGIIIVSLFGIYRIKKRDSFNI